VTAGDPYVVVRRRIVDDERYADAWSDEALLGWWLKLTLAADAAWPASAEVPGSCPPDVVSRLAAAELLVVYPRGRYRLVDYDLEREGRSQRGAAGGRARADAATRDTSGRYQRPDPANGGSVQPQPLNTTQRSSAHPMTTTPPPPPAEGRRSNGTNPRAVGSNPRALGTSARQERQAEKRGGIPFVTLAAGPPAGGASNGPTRPPCSDFSRGLWEAHRNDRHAGDGGAEHCRTCSPVAGCRICAPTPAIAG
jgi:hypothetical protein